MQIAESVRGQRRIVQHVGSARVEPPPGGPCPKLVFAPPEGERASNVHVVGAASDAARRKLLFRDLLRAYKHEKRHHGLRYGATSHSTGRTRKPQW